MTTWSCQLGRNTSIGILEAERAMTLQIMKNGRSPMLACFFTVAETRDIWGGNGKRGIHVCDARMRERETRCMRFAFLFLPQTAATSTICASKYYKHPTMRQSIQTNMSSQTFYPPTRSLPQCSMVRSLGSILVSLSVQITTIQLHLNPYKIYIIKREVWGLLSVGRTLLFKVSKPLIFPTLFGPNVHMWSSGRNHCISWPAAKSL